MPISRRWVTKPLLQHNNLTKTAQDLESLSLYLSLRLQGKSKGSTCMITEQHINTLHYQVVEKSKCSKIQLNYPLEDSTKMLPYYLRHGVSKKCTIESCIPTTLTWLLPVPTHPPISSSGHLQNGTEGSKTSHLQTPLGITKDIPRYHFCEAQHCSLIRMNVLYPKGQRLQHFVSEH